MDELSDAHHDAWRLLLTTHAKLLDRVNKEVVAAGMIALEWYDVLLTLDRAPDRRLRMSELAEAVLFSRSGLTRLVDRIESAGFLRREAVPTDRRGSYAALTEEGAAELDRAWPEYRKAIARNFGRGLSEAEARTLAALLLKAQEEA